MIKGISHITLVVNDLQKSSTLFSFLFDAQEVYSSDGKEFSLFPEKFLVIGGIWFALMQGESSIRTYRHIAFQIDAQDLPYYQDKIRDSGLETRPSRHRYPQEGQSLYFYDYDHHLFELHTGSLDSRLAFYKSFHSL